MIDSPSIEDIKELNNDLLEENSKLREEVKELSKRLIEYTNYFNHMKMSLEIINEKIKLDIVKQQGGS